MKHVVEIRLVEPRNADSVRDVVYVPVSSVAYVQRRESADGGITWMLVLVTGERLTIMPDSALAWLSQPGPAAPVSTAVGAADKSLLEAGIIPPHYE